MTRIEKILVRARDTLADPDGTRWSNAKLLRLLDEAQKDLCRRAKLLRSKTSMIVFDGQAEYTMPDDFLLIDKVTINNEPIKLIGHTDLDNNVSKWEIRTGKVTNVVFDKQMRGKIRLYPIPDYENDNRLKEVPAFNSYYYGKIQGKYGVVADMSNAGQFVNDVYGVTAEVTGIYQWQETPTDMPKVVVKDYKMLSRFGFASSVNFTYTPDYRTTQNLGVVTSVDNSTIDPFGVITSVDGVDNWEVNFSDINGEGTEFGLYSDSGFITMLSRRGEIVDIQDAKLNTSYGFIAGIEKPDDTNVMFDSKYGLTTSVSFIRNVMDIWYIRKPLDIISLDSEIEIDNSFDNALKYYIVGKAFRDDIDAQNRAVGQEELAFYERELQEALSDDSHDFTRNNSVQFETTYGGGIFR